MNEAGWLSSSEPVPMLEFLRGKASDRKLRLFAVACCRTIGNGTLCLTCEGGGVLWGSVGETCPDCHGTGRIGGLTDPRSRRAVEVAERYADEGETVAKEMGRAWLYLDMESPHESIWILAYLACCPPDALARSLTQHADAVSRLIPPAVQAALLRDIFGNPFRKTTCGWRTVTAAKDMSARALESGASEESVWRGDWCVNSTVLGMARSIYTERDFARMQVLADCLEEAGCEDQDILMHCRGMERCPDCFDGDEGTRVYCERCGKNGGAGRMGWIRLRGPHVRGCHVVDLLLGKE